MSAGQRQIRNSTTNLESHFEKSLQELNAPKKGTIGRSADVQELIAGEQYFWDSQLTEAGPKNQSANSLISENRESRSLRRRYGRTEGSAQNANTPTDHHADEEGSDALKETFILRKTSLTQEQWDLYLSTDTSRPGKEDIHESTALLSRKSNISQGSFTGDGAVSSRKNTSFDVETGASVSKGQARLPLISILGGIFLNSA